MKKSKPMMPTIFRVNSEGKKQYTNNKEAIEAILDAVHRGQEIVNIGELTMQIKEQIRTDEVWTVEIVL